MRFAGGRRSGCATLTRCKQQQQKQKQQQQQQQQQHQQQQQQQQQQKGDDAHESSGASIPTFGFVVRRCSQETPQVKYTRYAESALGLRTFPLRPWSDGKTAVLVVKFLNDAESSNGQVNSGPVD